MDSNNIINQHHNACEKVLAAFKKELHGIRTGRASTGLVENIMVDYYGAKTPISHLGQLSTPEARVILIQTYDPAATPTIEKAIQMSNLGINPARDGNSIRLIVPPLTEQSRKELVKMVARLAEEMKVSTRNHRRDANEEIKKLEKEGTLTKDELKKAQDKIQKQTDITIEEIERIFKAKEAECLEV
ncbi:MAG: ribosome recycling factor [Deltaproteobacteria bacterium]|jgi:ribosome recycling factor|nr:ribosome recycling factor [Deltaproteobacteria bacterium]